MASNSIHSANTVEDERNTNAPNVAPKTEPSPKVGILQKIKSKFSLDLDVITVFLMIKYVLFN